MPMPNDQVGKLIMTYMKNMKVRAGQISVNPEDNSCDYELNIAQEGTKRMVYERIGEQLAEKLKRNDHGEE